MATQPNSCSKDVLANNFINFDEILSSLNDFFHEYNSLTLSSVNGPLVTPELEITNPFILSTPESYIDSSNGTCDTNFQELQSMVVDEEPSIPSELTDEDEQIISLILDLQANVNSMDNNSHQQMHTPAQGITEIKDYLRNDIMDFQAVLTAMKRYPNARMQIHTQPVAKHRFRYRTDGIRYLEQSRRHPMAINLPRLDGCLIKSYQSFWIQLTIVTTRQNPQRKVFLHEHEMIYNAVDAQQNGLASFRLPLTDDDIRRRKKTFRHLSIIKTKHNDYRFQLVHFDPSSSYYHVEHYTIPNEDKMTKVQKAKQFDRLYHTNNYQIACQLMIKQKDQWYTTDLYCETHVVTHK